jgi:outer membrane protein assembly factor BamB
MIKRFGLIGSSLSLAVAIACYALPSVLGEEESNVHVPWTQWRGPHRNGLTTETVGFASWPKVEIKKLWELDLGVGYSASSVSGDRVYTMGYSNGKDTVYCLNARTGKEIWTHSYSTRNYSMMNAGGPAGTPSVVDGRVYTMSRSTQTYCLDARDGKVLWQKNFRQTAGAKVPTWGFSGSPLVKGDRVYFDVGAIIALDRKTGKRIWGTTNYSSGYSSPVAFTYKSKEYLAVFPGHGLVILEEGSGKEVAKHRWRTNYNVNAATPLILKNGAEIFISSGYNTGCAMLKFDGSKLTELWRNRNMRNQMASSVYYKGHVYGFDESVLKCLDAGTGAVVWRQRGLGKGSLILVKDILVVLSDRGELVLARADSKGFKPAKRQQILRGGSCWTAPVLTRQQLYVRNPKGQLVCLQVGAIGKSAASPKKTPVKKRKFF